MSFIDMGLGDDIKEDKPVPPEIYTLRIAEAEPYKKEGSNHVSSIRCIINIEGTEAPPIYHYISLPQPEDDDKKKRTKSIMAKRFLTAFNIPFEPTGFNYEDFPGASSDLWVGLEEGTRDEATGRQYPPKNVLDLPKLVDED